MTASHFSIYAGNVHLGGYCDVHKTPNLCFIVSEALTRPFRDFPT